MTIREFLKRCAVLRRNTSPKGRRKLNRYKAMHDEDRRRFLERWLSQSDEDNRQWIGEKEWRRLERQKSAAIAATSERRARAQAKRERRRKVSGESWMAIAAALTVAGHTPMVLTNPHGHLKGKTTTGQG